jgi:parallel beta-helix repeat protein
MRAFCQWNSGDIQFILIIIVLTSIYSNNNLEITSTRSNIPKDDIILKLSDTLLEPTKTRILVVAKDGSGNYSSIQAALNNSKPGDTIQVKDGVYKERVDFYISGTRDLPITLMNYPGHSPVIDAGGGSYPVECCPSSGTQRVEFNAEWIILEGFEIRYGWDGVKVYEPHNTIRNNWIHHNRYQGILVVSTSDVFIEGNTIEYNGTDPGACYDSSWGGESPKHCHGVYISDFHCAGMSNITIRGNVLSNNPGRGIQWNGEGCSSKMRNTLVENNIIENNSWGIVLWYNVEDSVIRNNTFVLEKYPVTSDTSHTFIGILRSTDNAFRNNIFYSTRSDVAPLQTFDMNSDQNTIDYNLWKVNTNSWVWRGSWRGDFGSNYKSITGWDSNSLFNADPGFYNVSNGIYHLTASSLARDSGQKSECAPTDYDKEIRSDSFCDIGMDEYSN